MNRTCSPLLCALLMVFALCTLGCNEQSVAQADESPATRSTITESQTGASLAVELDQTEIDLAGVVQVSAQIAWSDGVHVQLIEPDWEEAGWSGFTTTPGSIVYDGTHYSQEFNYTLEPFLSGTYQIPSFGIRAESEEAGKRIARLQPIEVSVLSVLEESDSSELEPALGFAEPTSLDDDSNNTLGIWIGLGVTMFSCFAIVLLRSQEHDEGNHDLDPEAMLTAASSAKTLSDAELGGFHRALIQLSKDHAGIEPIAREIELVRFSGSVVDHQRVQSAASRALQICGGHS